MATNPTKRQAIATHLRRVIRLTGMAAQADYVEAERLLRRADYYRNLADTLANELHTLPIDKKRSPNNVRIRRLCKEPQFAN